MPTFQQINNPNPQANAPAIVNANFAVLEPFATYGANILTTTGLFWGYLGGRWGGFLITTGSLTLTASATNYIVVAIATGVISVSTSATNWNDTTNYARVYKVTVGTTAPTAYEDHRGGPKGVFSAGGSGASTPFTGGTLASALNEAPPVTIASSTTPAIFAAAGNTINLTGTTTVTGFDTIAAGAIRRVVFGGVLQLTYNATSMINITGANITTAAGDIAEFESLGSGNTKMLAYTRASGAALVAGGFTGGTLTSALNEAPTVTIASSTTPAIGAAAGNSILLTGTTTVTGFDTIAAGAMRRIRFGGALVLTHNATSLILPGAANITTAANDVAEFLSLGSGNWFCTSYSRANGSALSSSRGVVALTSGATVNTNAALSDSFRLVLGVNATLANPTGLTDGQVLNFRLIQDATGSRTLAYGSLFKWAGGAAPVLSTAANAVDFLSCQYDATSNTILGVLNKAFA